MQTSLALDNDDRPHISYIHRRHTWSFGCAWEFNACHDLRYAEPFAATAAWTANGAAGEPIGAPS